MIDPPWKNHCKWHRMTRVKGQDYAIIFNYTHRDEGQDRGGGGEVKKRKKPLKSYRRYSSILIILCQGENHYYDLTWELIRAIVFYRAILYCRM